MTTTVLHLKSKAGPDGKVHLGDMDVGQPGADVDIVVSINKKQLTQEEWRREMEALLNDMADVHLETYPRNPVRDPWSEN
jgi:hypothetical protein